MIDISDSIEIKRINASVSRGGWECTLSTLSDSDLLVTHQRIRVMWRGIFGDVDYGIRPAFIGYVIPSRVEFDRAASITDFIANTSDGFLRNGWLQGLGLADRDTTARDHYHQWDSVTGGADAERLTLGRIVRHILGFYDELGAPPATNPDWVAHTNLVYHATENPSGWISLEYVEVEPFDAATNPDGTMRTDEYVVRQTTNMWQAIQDIAKNEFFVAYFDKQDRIHYEKHPMYRETLPEPVMTFDSSFCVAPLSIEFRESEQVSQVKLHAVTDEGDTLHSVYPPGTEANIVDNPGFETDTAGWTGTGSVITRVAGGHSGAWQLRVVTAGGATGQGAYYYSAETSTPNKVNTTFVGTVWAFSAGGGETVRVRLRDRTNEVDANGTATVLGAGVWTELSVELTVGDDPCDLLTLYFETTVAAAATLYIDDCGIYPPPLAVYGDTVNQSQIRCNDQDTLDNWCERYYWWLNRDTTVKWTAAGYAGLLFEILDRVQITYEGSDENGVHFNWVKKRFWIHEIDVRFGEGLTGTTVFTLEAENIPSGTYAD